MGPIGADAPEKKKESLINRLMSTISGIFTPIIPALIAGGMLKALLTLLTFFKVVDNTSQTYYMINFIADSAFYFLPVLVAVSTAARFKCNLYIAAAIGAALLHPNFTALVSAGESVKFCGLPVTLISYGSSIIPSILAVWLMSYAEPFADKISPKPIKFLSKPLITILIVAPVTFLVLGPLGYTVGTGLAAITEFLNQHVSWLVPTLMGAFISVGIGFAITFILTLVFGFEDVPENGAVVKNTKAATALDTKIEIGSPTAGKAVKLSEVNDETFASGVLGKGAAVVPTDGKVVAPAAGKILSVFPSKHAVSMVDENGVELLIHLGIDTVKLDGKHFTAHVKDGDMVKKGDLLVEFDKAAVEAEGYDTTVIVVVINTQEFLDVIPAGQGETEPTKTLFTIV